MSKHKKTIELLRRKNLNISFDKAKHLLIHMKFKEIKSDGSHCKFSHSNGKSINLVRNVSLKGYLIEEMLDILEFFGVDDDV